MSEETRKKQAEAHKGKKRGHLLEEHRRKLSESLKGRKLTEEQKEKIREGMRKNKKILIK